MKTGGVAPQGFQGIKNETPNWHIVSIGVSDVVDSKGIEPSNLTDANRALSQLSYEPKFELLSLKQGDFASKSTILITF